MSIDYNAVRRRLEELKRAYNLKNYDFCKIYNPDKCGKAESNATNYMSAIFSGRNYPNNTSGPAKIELVY